MTQTIHYVKNERKSDGSNLIHFAQQTGENRTKLTAQTNTTLATFDIHTNMPHLFHLEGERRQNHGHRGHCHCSGSNRRRQHDRVDQREENPWGVRARRLIKYLGQYRPSRIGFVIDFVQVVTCCERHKILLLAMSKRVYLPRKGCQCNYISERRAGSCACG